jgi:hypothetical protein
MKELTVPTGYEAGWAPELVPTQWRIEKSLSIAENRTTFRDRLAHTLVTIPTELEPKIAGDRDSL